MISRRPKYAFRPRGRTIPSMAPGSRVGPRSGGAGSRRRAYSRAGHQVAGIRLPSCCGYRRAQPSSEPASASFYPVSRTEGRLGLPDDAQGHDAPMTPGYSNRSVWAGAHRGDPPDAAAMGRRTVQLADPVARCTWKSTAGVTNLPEHRATIAASGCRVGPTAATSPFEIDTAMPSVPRRIDDPGHPV